MLVHHPPPPRTVTTTCAAGPRAAEAERHGAVLPRPGQRGMAAPGKGGVWCVWCGGERAAAAAALCCYCACVGFRVGACLSVCCMYMRSVFMFRFVCVCYHYFIILVEGFRSFLTPITFFKRPAPPGSTECFTKMWLVESCPSRMTA